MQDRLLGLWCASFTGATQGILPDLSGNDNHCNLLNADRNTSWQTNGNRLSFFHDGLDDRVFSSAFRMSDMSDQQNSFSIWINPTNTNASSRPFSLGASGTSFAIRFNFQNLEFSFGGTAPLSVPMTNAQFQNRWTHVCGVADATGARMFFDGRLVGTRSDTVSLTKTNGLGIGYRFGTNSEFFSGYIDDFRLYGRTLRTSEIGHLFALDRGGGLSNEPPKRRSFFVPTLPTPLPVRRRSSRFLTFPG
jgi:hypothetical protein